MADISPSQTPASNPDWTAGDFFAALRELGALRVITTSGPSIFEAICELGPFGIADGWLNAMTDSYHWHLDLRRLRHLTSCDAVHERSGRRVLFFELREAAEREPFLLIYLHRAKGEEFGAAREDAFAALHRGLSQGAELGRAS